MSDITLEKVDQIIDRTYVTYAEAKEALEKCNGDVLEALIYIENKQKEEYENKCEQKSEIAVETLDDLKLWLKDILKKGNISRVKIKKNDKTLVDIPVNAGLAAGAIALLYPPVLAVGVVTAVATKLVIEITKVDGTVEIVNKIVKNATKDFTKKAKTLANEVKDKTSDFKESIKNDLTEKNNKQVKDNSKTYNLDNESNFTYTVNFEEMEK
ncbi:DUF4342 domain-containing protein [Clostridium tarantellae]|uniref:DUF4342 domain-containing protein n=1 Tax=Clostridium tarantellae TaxID=39493 RepID=A0A6I1MHB8_9CLOT|nr:DUF4342 domain-containing protein [Clostridium tarantellae]MPQ42234.1 DUF4342 domain-containing protein [Clostridium tarantellae]